MYVVHSDLFLNCCVFLFRALFDSNTRTFAYFLLSADTSIQVHLVRGFRSSVFHKTVVRVHVSEMSGYLLPSQALALATSASIVHTQVRAHTVAEMGQS